MPSSYYKVAFCLNSLAIYDGVYFLRGLHRFGRQLGPLSPLDSRTYKLLLAEIHLAKDVIGTSPLQMDFRLPKLLEDPRDGCRKSYFDRDSSGHRFVNTNYPL